MVRKWKFSEFSDNYPLKTAPETIDFKGFLKGYRRNGRSPIQGIDTLHFLRLVNGFLFVEMGEARYRALTQLFGFLLFLILVRGRNGKSPIQGIDTILSKTDKLNSYAVEMGKARYRALTQI